MQSDLQPEGMLFSGRCIPDGLIENIFIRLPVKSLIRFKTVQKSWRDFLSSPYFVQLQLDHAQKTPKLLLYSQSAETYIHDIAIIDKTKHNPVSKNPIFTPFQFQFNLYCISVSGVIEDSYNGLLSFRFKEDLKFIYLWNPATRESRSVELPYKDSHPCVGIAFDAKINDFKMVRFPSSVEDSSKKASIWVYSLKSDIWKELNLYFRCGPLVSGHAVSVHGCMHWITKADGFHIAAFDVENEILRYIELPCVDGKSFTDRKLGVIRGALSVVTSFFNSEDDLTYEIWQMSDYGVGNSWKKQVLFIDALDEMPVPLGFYNDRVLFKYYRNSNDDVFSYDPFTGVKMQYHLPPCLNLQVVNYIETFASLAM